MVVCAGAKSILDLGLTLEYLETHGVTVIGYGTSELPRSTRASPALASTTSSTTPSSWPRRSTPSASWVARRLLVTNPIPEEYSMDKEVIDKAIAEAGRAQGDGIHGKATTPFCLPRSGHRPAATVWIPTSSSCSTTRASARRRLWSSASSKSEILCHLLLFAAINFSDVLRLRRRNKRRAQISGRGALPESSICTRAPARQWRSFRNEGLSPQDAALVLQVRRFPAILLAHIARRFRVCAFFRGVKIFGKFLVFVKQNRRFLRLTNQAKENWAKRENKEFYEFSIFLFPYFPRHGKMYVYEKGSVRAEPTTTNTKG